MSTEKNELFTNERCPADGRILRIAPDRRTVYCPINGCGGYHVPDGPEGDDRIAALLVNPLTDDRHDHDTLPERRIVCKNCGCPPPRQGEIGLYCSACGAGINYGGKTWLFNTSIITAHGVYRFLPITLTDAYGLARGDCVESAIGHHSTAEILTELLSRDVPVNRVFAQQQPGDLAIVFKLRGRPEEGRILSRAEIDAIGYDFGLLIRIS